MQLCENLSIASGQSDTCKVRDSLENGIGWLLMRASKSDHIPVNLSDEDCGNNLSMDNPRAELPTP